METLKDIGLQPAIIGGLIGSILTVLISKILDILQKSKEHKYSLQKEYFIKKLSAAEEAITAWYNSANSIGVIAKLYSQFPYLKGGMNFSLFSILNTRIEDQLNKINEISLQIRYGIFLYFDFDDESFWQNESLRLFYSYLSEIANHVNFINYGLDLLKFYNEGKDINLDDENVKLEIKTIRDLIVNTQNELETTMNKFTDILDTSREGMINVIKEIRQQIKTLRFSKNI